MIWMSQHGFLYGCDTMTLLSVKVVRYKKDNITALSPHPKRNELGRFLKCTGGSYHIQYDRALRNTTASPKAWYTGLYILC